MKIIMYTGILSSGWLIVSAIIGIVVGLLLSAIGAMFHLAFKYPKKYAFYVSVVLATFVVGGYVLHNPSILSTLNEKIATNTVLLNIIFGVAIFTYNIVILSVFKIVNGILRGE